MIVGFILPKRLARAAEDGVGLARRMILDCLGDAREIGFRVDQDVDMVDH